MSYTKRKLIEKAFSSIGLANYVFDLTAEQLDDARTSLDAMMALWESKGIRLGYSLPTNPDDSDLDDESGIPDQAAMPVFMNLGQILAAGIGKMVPREIKQTAHQGYLALLSKAQYPPTEMQMPSNMPSGAGNKPGRTTETFLTPPEDRLITGGDGPLTFG